MTNQPCQHTRAVSAICSLLCVKQVRTLKDHTPPRAGSAPHPPSCRRAHRYARCVLECMCARARALVGVGGRDQGPDEDRDWSPWNPDLEAHPTCPGQQCLWPGQVVGLEGTGLGLGWGLRWVRGCGAASGGVGMGLRVVGGAVSKSRGRKGGRVKCQAHQAANVTVGGSRCAWD